jgi:hypothetical protein
VFGVNEQGGKNRPAALRRPYGHESHPRW